MAARLTSPVGSETESESSDASEEQLDEAALRAKLASIAKANREAAGLSPGEAARRAHLSRAAVRDVEGRKGWPRVDTLVAYARAVGTTPWALLRSAHVEADPSVESEVGEAAVPVDLNAILLAAGASEQTWRTAKALLEALVANDP